jgi:hypothetical protein
MTNPALAVVEAALRARKLDRTLTTALAVTPPADAAATSVMRLDEALGGGLPRGQLSEIVGTRSSGRTALLLQLVAATTRRGEIAALVDTFDQLDITSAVSAAVDLDRFLWIRGHGGRPQASGLRPQGGLRPQDLKPQTWPSPEAWGLRPEAYIERALKALNLVLQAGGFGVVAIDVGDASSAALRTIPLTTWLRVQRTIEGSDTTCVIVGPQPLGRSAGGLTLMLEANPRWSSILTGFDLAVRVVSARRHVDGQVTMGAQMPGCAGA